MQGSSSPARTDRTAEFFGIADVRCQQRGRPPSSRPRPQRTAFGASSSRVGQALHELDGRVVRLSKLASKTSLFDDPALEIAEISGLIKQHLGRVSGSIEALARSGRPAGAQFAAHAEAVLSYLKGGLQRGSEGFQHALQTREAILSAKEARAEKIGVGVAATPTPAGRCGGGGAGSSRTPSGPLGGSGGAGGFGGSFSGAAFATPGNGASVLQRRRPHPAYATPVPAAACGDGGFGGCGEAPGSAVAIDMGGFSGGAPGSGGQQAQAFWTPRSRQHRQEEMSQMQSTLAELGTMFQKFTSLVSEQGEMVRRIDLDTEVAATNVEQAHIQIKKFQKHISGNRSLIIKSFLVLFFFIVLFGTVLR
ncbi:syntaxin 5 [Emiliania huxleyi CCMP1516]|uniref:t-SNARE coiled-coil homology domain-containing protein n=2 Tax=Emiliania huxleyi TaxID=2903 RepID=A0A0D3JFH3_EMIH1|nr:syntaxin 5 [Emiliania huxleyi CCMP1516]EOD22258.1 syntaxin 5 [Emiliania huxleyi CCMP1516]|eukprot:XP_005774687.1 syntaxin 5 [Emiliania huxleyi CCMP1516]